MSPSGAVRVGVLAGMANVGVAAGVVAGVPVAEPEDNWPQAIKMVARVLRIKPNRFMDCP